MQQSHSGLHSFRPKYSLAEQRQTIVDVDRAWIKQRGLKGIFPFSFRESPANHPMTFNNRKLDFTLRLKPHSLHTVHNDTVAQSKKIIYRFNRFLRNNLRQKNVIYKT